VTLGKKSAKTGRPKGSRSPDYENQRAELIAKIQRRLTAQDAVRPSMRAMAAADVTVPTLTHYFGTREDVVAAVMHRHLEVGSENVKHVATPHGPFAESVREILEYAAAGFRHGRLGEIHSMGLVEGLRHSRLGGE
jgi:hypothetical protein